MTGKKHAHKHPVHHAPAAGQASHRHATHGAGRRRWSVLRRGAVRFLRHRYLRRLFWTTTVCVAMATVGFLGLWWRLSRGPIELDMATPWLKAAIEQNFDGKLSVELRLNATRRAAPPCACATLSCATSTARWWRARRKPRSACPA